MNNLETQKKSRRQCRTVNLMKLTDKKSVNDKILRSVAVWEIKGRSSVWKLWKVSEPKHLTKKLENP